MNVYLKTVVKPGQPPLAGQPLPRLRVDLARRVEISSVLNFHVNSAGPKANPGWYFQSNNHVVWFLSFWFVHQDLPPFRYTF